MRRIVIFAILTSLTYISKSQGVNAGLPVSVDGIEFNSGDVSSDFGKRNHGISWHNGIDYGGREAGSSINAIEAGTVYFIRETGFKYIVIGGTNNFTYGHIFKSNTTNDLLSGNYIVLKVKDYDRYAIFNIITHRAYGRKNTDFVTYNSIDYPVSNTVNAGDPIAAYGFSGGTAGNDYPVHLHVYRLHNAVNGTAPDLRANNNSLNPLEVVQYNRPNNYLISIPTNTASSAIVISNVSIPVGGKIINNITISPSTKYYDGSVAASVCYRVSMEGANGTGNYYNNMTMDLNKVELLWKREDEPIRNYKTFVGPTYNSRVSYAGRLNADGTLDEIYPPRLVNDKPNPNWPYYADFNFSGVEPYAYHTPSTTQLPYDEFYFSDIYTRIRNDHKQGTIPTFAYINDDARYPDGNYNVYARVTTIRNTVFPQPANIRPETIVIDNFRPYVKYIDVRGGGAAYTYMWVPTGDGNSLMPGLIKNTINPQVDVTVTITTSEPMKTMSASIGSVKADQTEGSDGSTRWKFVFTHGKLSLTSTLSLSIQGTDKNGNNLFDMLEQSASILKSSMPVRTGSSFSNTSSTAELITLPTCVSKKKSTAICGAYNPILPEPEAIIVYHLHFGLMNESTNATSYLWDFGDGTFSTEKDPYHSFDRKEYAQLFKVSLTAFNDNGISNTDYKDVIIIGNGPDGNLFEDGTIAFNELPADLKLKAEPLTDQAYSFNLSFTSETNPSYNSEPWQFKWIDVSNELMNGKTFSLSFTQSGYYIYFCRAQSSDKLIVNTIDFAIGPAYIEKIEFYEAGSANRPCTYTRKWNPDNNTFIFNRNVTGNISNNNDLIIAVTASQTIPLKMSMYRTFINEPDIIISETEYSKSHIYTIPKNKLFAGKYNFMFSSNSYNEEELLKDKQPAIAPYFIHYNSGPYDYMEEDNAKWNSSLLGVDDNYYINIIGSNGTSEKMSIIMDASANCTSATIYNGFSENCSVDFGDNSPFTTISAFGSINKTYSVAKEYTVRLISTATEKELSRKTIGF